MVAALPTRALKQVSATGDVSIGTAAALYGITLTAGDTTPASVTLHDRSSGSVMLTLKAPAGTTYRWLPGQPALPFVTVHVKLVGLGAVVSLEYAEIG